MFELAESIPKLKYCSLLALMFVQKGKEIPRLLNQSGTACLPENCLYFCYTVVTVIVVIFVVVIVVVFIQGIATSVQCCCFHPVAEMVCTLTTWCRYSFSSLKHYTSQALVFCPGKTRTVTRVSETGAVSILSFISGAELFL